jgi:hypothetical protein
LGSGHIFQNYINNCKCKLKKVKNNSLDPAINKRRGDMDDTIHFSNFVGISAYSHCPEKAKLPPSLRQRYAKTPLPVLRPEGTRRSAFAAAHCAVVVVVVVVDFGRHCEPALVRVVVVRRVAK